MALETYVGYDLGDGETITDLVKLETGKKTSKTVFDDMTMPDTTISGLAMPSVFAYDESGRVVFSQTIAADPDMVSNIMVNFKRRPSDLLNKQLQVSDAELIDFLKKSSDWPSASVWPAGNTEQMLRFKEAVIAFTNGIFTDPNYAARLRSAASSSEEIVFCVGHPTNWSTLDVEIYKLILKNSVLGTGLYEGKKSSMIVEAESRAAYLYAKDLNAFSSLPAGRSVLLIDIGSSTIDLTAMTASANNHQYNSGSNYLGARSIDFIIRKWYLEKLQQQPLMWTMYQSLLKNNPTIPGAMTLSCRLAKEKVYSSPAGIAQIYFGPFPGVKLTAKELDAIIESTPVAAVLQEYIQLDSAEAARMGSQSWKQLFKAFLAEKKAEMQRQNIKVAHIILTGSASRMTFVPGIVREVFNDISSDSLMYDMDPSRSISKGLALVGPTDVLSKVFEKKLNHLIDEKMPKIVESNIPALGKDMGKVIADILTPKMKGRIKEWRSGDIRTLNQMNAKIKTDCSDANLEKLLSNDSSYKKTIEKWLREKVGKDIAVELKALCEESGVHGIETKDLNIMTMPQITIGSIPLDPLSFMDTISVVVALIAGVISAVSITTIMAVITFVLSLISESLALSLFLALVGMGPVGWGILAVVVGLVVTVLVSGGFDAVKGLFLDKVMDWDLPGIARETMTDDKIDKSFTDANLPKQIEDAFKKQELKNEIVNKVSLNLKDQVAKRAQDIKYAIQNK